MYIDTHGRTGVDGLYAIGELSFNIERANRLGGNSTGACMVFGKLAAADCKIFLQTADFHEIVK
ncbi:FAD-binding protein [Pseudalkalibacillus sp. R45]|uniref:FAD-binding protein n=1 Tax=Pseudalkalibacillus sp. R45 TaxID=3457433 RepID=UPI003FCC9754